MTSEHRQDGTRAEKAADSASTAKAAATGLFKAYVFVNSAMFFASFTAAVLVGMN